MRYIPDTFIPQTGDGYTPPPPVDFGGGPLTYGGGGAYTPPVQTPPMQTPPPATLPPPAQTPPPATQNALSPADALNAFANSAGMQFQLRQGANTIQNMYAARGSLQSGAAMKVLQNYGQQTALQNYFMPYMGLLQGQQNVGAQAGSAVAGVGSNFSNTAAGIYGGMSNAIGNGADAQSNAALARGYANAGLGAGIASGVGQIASSFVPTGSSAAVANPGPITVYNSSAPFNY